MCFSFLQQIFTEPHYQSCAMLGAVGKSAIGNTLKSLTKRPETMRLVYELILMFVILQLLTHRSQGNTDFSVLILLHLSTKNCGWWSWAPRQHLFSE